ncbi:MAG: hypothetical protein HY220_02975 [Candidatus Sungbacteria bacterium]|uniref:Uncharacterized protein n=1 Tax=Candidatus Sungiibacteriota bacterium TaxID=2750080 RepID=A0A9D6LQB1_9BACT|nr:hypothetical protein [Candidatus Sungbacteria bacterium]
MIENAIHFWSQYTILANIVHVSGGFAVALLLQRYISGKAFLPTWVGWVLLIFAIAVHVVAFAMPASANGGDQRVVDGKYLINLSRAPFTPRAGEKTSMLISFVDLESNKLISEDMVIKIRIAKLGGVGSAKREFLFEQSNIKAQGGVLEFPYTFTETGLTEVFIDFSLASNPQKIYESPDFLLDVQSKESPQSINRFVISFILMSTIGIVLGFIFGFWSGQRTKSFLPPR